MTYVVTGRCVDCRYTYCVVKCPVSCFWEIQQPHHMLVIDPDTCIDCDNCTPLCPINAIWPESELPHEGSLSLQDAPGQRGTEVHLRIAYEPRGGRFGQLLLPIDPILYRGHGSLAGLASTLFDLLLLQLLDHQLDACLAEL